MVRGIPVPVQARSRLHEATVKVGDVLSKGQLVDTTRGVIDSAPAVIESARGIGRLFSGASIAAWAYYQDNREALPPLKAAIETDKDCYQTDSPAQQQIREIAPAWVTKRLPPLQPRDANGRRSRLTEQSSPAVDDVVALTREGFTPEANLKPEGGQGGPLINDVVVVTKEGMQRPGGEDTALQKSGEAGTKSTTPPARGATGEAHNPTIAEDKLVCNSKGTHVLSPSCLHRSPGGPQSENY